MKNNVKLLLKSIQWQDDEKTETELMTDAWYEKIDDTFRIIYEDTSATGFEGSVTTIEIEGNNNAAVVRTGAVNSALSLEIGTKHYCHYDTPFGDMQIGVFTQSIDNKISECGKLHMKYTLDINSAYLSDNEIILEIKENLNQ
ncbi:MAG: DUF1934 domain-containing protein [Ruminococcus sp.]|nr:DUF1934 domain-containing protein [Ruminococcus sp.]